MRGTQSRGRAAACLPCSGRKFKKIRSVHPFLIRLLLGVCVASGSLPMLAVEPAAKGAATPSGQPAVAAHESRPAAQAAPARDSEVLTLPTIQVTAGRVKELDRAIKKLDKAISREKKNLKASDLDKALNNATLAKAAAVFGGNSAAYLETVAATRVRYMEAERDLLSDMKEPRTLQDLAILQKELDEIRVMQRELDYAKR